MLSEARKSYLESISKDNIVAFRNSENIYSGKVLEVVGKYVTIQTPNGSIYYVNKYEDIVWVKNGSKWPVGIFNALKRRRKDSKDERKY